jgi:superfamily II DNA or RNA helicase
METVAIHSRSQPLIPPPLEITDVWLMEMGGWQEMKRARALYASGTVLNASFDGTRLTGTVRDAGKDLATGLLLRSRSDMDNLCTCFQSKRHGTLCAHALAVGTAWVHRHEKQPTAPGATAAASPPGTGPARTTSPPSIQPATAPGPLEFGFPHSFFTALQRQKLGITVRPADSAQESSLSSLSGQSAQSSQPAHSTQSSQPNHPAAADRPLLLWLGSLQQKTVPPHLSLSGFPQITAALAALAGHPRLYLLDGPKKKTLTLSPDPARLPLVITTAGPGNVRLALCLPSLNTQTALPPTSRETGWLFDPDTTTLQALTLPGPWFKLLKTLPPGRPLEKPRHWLATHLADLQNHFSFDAEASSPGALTFRLVPDLPRFELHLEGSLEKLTARLRTRYEGGPEPFPPGLPDVSGFPLESPADPVLFRTRHRPAEAAAIRRLTACGFDPGPTPASDWTLTRENAILQFFAGELERLKAEWTITLGSRFTAATAKVERLAPRWTAVPGTAPTPRSGTPNDWLTFDLGFTSTRGTTLDRLEIARLLATGTGHKKLPDGRIAVVSLADAIDLNEVLRDVSPDQSGGGFRVRRSQLGYLEQTFGQPLTGRPATPTWPIETSVPPALLATLRDYQKTGVTWLLDHAAAGHGGILADEMGLGKTLQSLSLLTALRRQWPDCPALVVCPKSLLANWRAEAARFTPELTCLTLEGARRKKDFAAIPGTALIITSYQLLARDLAEHRNIEYGTVILDEAGFIRNPDTQAAQAARALNARVRFALTGTPIENGIRDLWSLTEFAVPGYLGPRKEFAERYETPLTSGGNAPLMARLRRRMAPYILRRLKQDVAKDLPAKIVQVQPCALTSLQQELYAGLMREGAAKVLDAENAKQQGQARMHLLTTLLRLRQTCCDPRLLKLELPKQPPADLSGKIEALASLLEEIREGGHSVIIFSAFASMLRLLQETVSAAGLGYSHIDGSTTDRAAQVEAFQTDPDKRVFLISLKAGGYGLNLTKADTVIHFDPWWNPAVEAQATDRAHRIGQERPVTVYKLITTGTVEEKILKLQEKKRNLMDAALDDDAPLMEGLTDEDLRSLLT